MKKQRLRRMLAALSCAVLLVQGAATGAVSAETVEKPVAVFSASDGETQTLLYGTTFYVDWKSADGLPGDDQPGQGADLSGSAANGAHKKMFLKTTLTLTALQEGVDAASSFKHIGFRLRSARVDGNEQASDFYYLYPEDVDLSSGTLEVSIPLQDIGRGSINWADTRQLIVMCELTEGCHLTGPDGKPAPGDTDRLRFGLANTRIVREMTEGEVDRDELTDLVNEVINEADYTPESVAVYRQAVDAGRLILANDGATQEQVDDAAAAIKQAKRELVSSAEVYKDTLQTLLEEGIATDGCTPDSAAACEAALDAGQEVLDNPEATQQQVNEAVMAIMAAKMNRVPVQADPLYQTLVSFSGSNQSYNYLNSGKNFYTDWKTGDGLTDQNSAEKGFDASGTADNGSDSHVYLQMQVAFTPLSESADAAGCFKQIGVRLRSSAKDGQEQAADFFYFGPDTFSPNEDGTYTIRIPLRVMKTANIDWTDVKQLNILAEVQPEYCLVNEDGSEKPGNSPDIGFTLGHVSLVKKNVRTMGDVDGKDGVTASDALLALQAATGKVVLDALAAPAADVDGQTGVTAADALLILQCATGKIGSLEREEKKMVAFTFDDGPSENTAALLDALKERGARATFFVIGKQAEQHPELVARMAAEGHEVGNHSYSHDGINITEPDDMIADYEKCSDLIEEYTGKRPTLMRAVGGTTVDSIHDYVKEQNLRLCGWVGGGDDYNQTDKDVVVNFYMDEEGNCTISDGDLVLLHENHASSVQAALELIDLLMADGYECVTVQELLDARAGGGVPGAQYSQVISLD